MTKRTFLKSKLDPGINEFEKKDKIYLIQQFYISKFNNRNNEIKECLKKNNNNNFIDKIILLNEKIYSKDELGLKSNKIEQINIKKRLSYKDCFKYIYNNDIKGYFIISNCDIFFDNTINNIFRTSLFNKRCIYAQLRNDNLNGYKTKFNFNAQDSWLFHTNNKIKNIKKYNILLGKGGCENVFLKKIYDEKFTIYNIPNYIVCNHLHKNINERTWSKEKFYTDDRVLITPIYLNKK